MGKKYRVGTRTSPLALKQVDEAIDMLREEYSDIETEVFSIDTFGDRDKTTPISQIEGTDFFTKEIDKALLEERIDFAVHSAKDLPDEIPEGLQVAAITASIDPYDVLVSRDGTKLDKLSQGAKIGTSSVRRKVQIKRHRDDLKIVDIRGNIEERLEQLYNSNLDAIVIAAAGLIRLGLCERITQRLTFDIMKPHILQGALAFVARTSDKDTACMLKAVDGKKGANRYYEN